VRLTRLISSRLLRGSLLFALVMSVAFGNAASASCEMHGLGALRAGDPAMSRGAMSMGHGDAESHRHGRTDGAPSDDCACSCSGDCIGARVPGVVPAAPTVRVSVAAPRPVRALDVGAQRPRIAEPDRLLPFANGPPRTATV
jgi:hypothetical protein